MSNLLNKIHCFHHFFWPFFSAFPICMPKSELLPRHSWLRSCFLKSDRSDSLTVALRATGAICSLKKANCYFALSLTKNEWLAKKPKSGFPTLFCHLNWDFFIFHSSPHTGLEPWIGHGNTPPTHSKHHSWGFTILPLTSTSQKQKSLHKDNLFFPL